MNVPPEILALSTQLAEVAVRNTASAVTEKVGAAKRKRDDKKTIGQLEEIIHSLQEDRRELISVATAYEEEIAARKISDEEIDYIAKNVVPKLKVLLKLGENKAEETEATITAVEALISTETIKVLQSVGFNFRNAIGQPLTELLARAIINMGPHPNSAEAELKILSTKRELEYLRIALDEDAHLRLKALFPD